MASSMLPTQLQAHHILSEEERREVEDKVMLDQHRIFTLAAIETSTLQLEEATAKAGEGNDQAIAALIGEQEEREKRDYVQEVLERRKRFSQS